MELDYQIIRSNRRTISIQIKPDGSILVRCPRAMRKAQIVAFVESKSQWIQKQLSRLPSNDLEKLCDDEIERLRNQTKSLIEKRVSYYAPMIGVSYNRISVRIQHTRWGSCSSKGNLNFNCLLALLPQDVVDYVVVHELCHLKQMNHSARFWSEVRAILPDYEISKHWLQNHGSAIIAKIEAI